MKFSTCALSVRLSSGSSMLLCSLELLSSIEMTLSNSSAVLAVANVELADDDEVNDDDAAGEMFDQPDHSELSVDAVIT
jgi:hypothetical protein